MRRLFATIIAVVAFGGSGPLTAHHSTAMFNLESRITLNGTVKAFQWTNPHIWLQVVAARPHGGPAQWSHEGGSPNTLSRQGWKKTTFNYGDKITVVMNPMKDGTHAGLLVNVKLADGTVLGSGVTANSGTGGE
jgi:hypothetical protein